MPVPNRNVLFINNLLVNPSGYAAPAHFSVSCFTRAHSDACDSPVFLAEANCSKCCVDVAAATGHLQ
jgi:hypothetical protein